MSLKDLALVQNGAELIDVPTALIALVSSSSSPVPLVLSSTPVLGGIQLQFETDLTAAQRRSVTFRSKPAVFDAKTKVWSKQKRSVSISGPTETMGTIQAAAIRIELDVPATIDVEGILTLLNYACVCLTDANARKFWTLGSPE